MANKGTTIIGQVEMSVEAAKLFAQHPSRTEPDPKPALKPAPAVKDGWTRCMVKNHTHINGGFPNEVILQAKEAAE